MEEGYNQSFTIFKNRFLCASSNYDYKRSLDYLP